MRIGIDIRLIGKNRTGDETVFFNLVRTLAKIDTKNKYILFTDIAKKTKLEEVKKQLEISEKENFEIVSLRTGNKFAWNFWILPNQLRKKPVDIYLTQYITPFFVSRKIKIITIIHDISFNFFPQFIKKTDLFFLKILIPLSIRRADKILGVSEFTKNEIIKYYKVDSKKVDFFYNAIADNFVKNYSEEEIRNIRKKYNLPVKFVLYLGTLQPRKNIPFLIESYSKISNSLSGIKLVLVGSKKAHNFDIRIDEVIEKNNLHSDIIFAGFVDEEDKFAIYKMANAFVFPSLYEGFGIPILEAFSAGTPTLASNIESLKEVAEKGALFANPFDVDKFSKALYDISIDESIRKSLVLKGYERAEFFSWEKTARKVWQIFNNTYRQ